MQERRLVEQHRVLLEGSNDQARSQASGSGLHVLCGGRPLGGGGVAQHSHRAASRHRASPTHGGGFLAGRFAGSHRSVPHGASRGSDPTSQRRRQDQLDLGGATGPRSSQNHGGVRTGRRHGFRSAGVVRAVGGPRGRAACGSRRSQCESLRSPRVRGSVPAVPRVHHYRALHLGGDPRPPRRHSGP